MIKYSSFKVQGKKVGLGFPCLIIAEVAQAHDGSLGMAHSFIDAIADSGADAVKFQTHIASAESTPSEPWRIKFSKQDATRYDYWKRMEFSEEQWLDLREHAEKKDLVFLSSPFSDEAIDLLANIGVPAWKVASGELNNIQLLDRMCETGLPLILSSGMSDIAELDQAVKILQDKKLPYAVLQCTSEYPCPPEKVGINMISFLRDRYKCPVGLSDHSGEIYSGLAAASHGINIYEVHVTFSKRMFGPDIAASLTFEQLTELVEGIRFIEKMLANPVDKNSMAREMKPLRELFNKSVVARANLCAGTVLRKEHLTTKKPGNGIPASQFDQVVGKRLQRDISKDELLRKDHFEMEDK